MAVFSDAGWISVGKAKGLPEMTTLLKGAREMLGVAVDPASGLAMQSAAPSSAATGWGVKLESAFAIPASPSSQCKVWLTAVSCGVVVSLPAGCGCSGVKLTGHGSAGESAHVANDGISAEC